MLLKSANKTFLAIIFTLIIVGLVSTGPVLAEEPAEENNLSLFFQPYFTTFSPDEINDVIQDTEDWADDMESDLSADLVNEFENQEDELSASTVYDEDVLRADEFENAWGLSLGASYFWPQYSSSLEVKGEGFTASSDMDGEIEVGIELERETDDNTESIDIDVMGKSENEIDVDLRGVSATVNPHLTDNLSLLAGVGYYWGEGDMYHYSEAELDYRTADDDFAEDLNLDDYDRAEIEYNSDLNFAGSAGLKLGADYNYSLADNVELKVSGVFRQLEMDVEVNNRSLEADADGEVFERYFDLDGLGFEPEDDFTDDLGGFEVAAGINFSW